MDPEELTHSIVKNIAQWYSEKYQRKYLDIQTASHSCLFIYFHPWMFQFSFHFVSRRVVNVNPSEMQSNRGIR